jgi:hypothetical protein
MVRTYLTTGAMVVRTVHPPSEVRYGQNGYLPKG